MSQCIFCKLIDGTITSHPIFENDLLIVFADIKPKALTHWLIVPRIHVPDIQTMADPYHIGGALIATAKTLATQLTGNGDFQFQINSGPKAGQEIFHVHAHFMSRETVK